MKGSTSLSSGLKINGLVRFTNKGVQALQVGVFFDNDYLSVSDIRIVVQQLRQHIEVGNADTCGYY